MRVDRDFLAECVAIHFIGLHSGAVRHPASSRIFGFKNRYRQGALARDQVTKGVTSHWARADNSDAPHKNTYFLHQYAEMSCTGLPEIEPIKRGHGSPAIIEISILFSKWVSGRVGDPDRRWRGERPTTAEIKILFSGQYGARKKFPKVAIPLPAKPMRNRIVALRP